MLFGLSPLIFLLMPVVAMALIWWLTHRVNRAVSQRDANGRRVPLTPMGRTHLAGLALDADLIARLGTGDAPEQDLGAITLRTSFGVRLISASMTLLVGSIVALQPGEFLPDDPLVYIAGGALFIYSFAFIWLYRLTYDRYGFRTTGPLFGTKEVLWRDVATLQDNGHYLYVVRTHAGRKVEVQKYLTGIRDFLAYAQDQIDYHDRRHG